MKYFPCIFLKLPNTYTAVLLLIILVILVSPLISHGQQQKRVDILDASRIVGDSFEGEEVRRILGNVHIKHEDFEMYCDSAYQFVNQDEIRAYGNIEIDTGEEKIWADSLTYFTDVDFSELRGRVILDTDSTTIFGNSVDYRFSTKVAHFIDQIRLEDQRGVLRADSGYYYRSADSVRFHGQVQLTDSLQYLEGDSLFSNRSKDYYEIHGQIFGDDQENNTMLQGAYLEADSTGQRLLEGDDAWLINFESDTSDTTQPADTTHIWAQTIISQEHRHPTDTTIVTHAYENVRVWSPNFASLSDTTQYSDSTQTFELWSNAKAWHDNVQLTGPYIKAMLKDGDIDSLQSYPQPFSVQQDTTIDRLNQITGDTLTAGFTEGNLSEIFVFNNAKLLRFTKNQQNESDGAIELSAPTIRILFEDGELVRMIANGSNKGSFFPENEETAERTLDGFVWNPDLRPQKPTDPMESRFPTIPEELFFELPARYIEHLRQTQPDSPRLQEDNEDNNIDAEVDNEVKEVENTDEDSTAID